MAKVTQLGVDQIQLGDEEHPAQVAARRADRIVRPRLRTPAHRPRAAGNRRPPERRDRYLVDWRKPRARAFCARAHPAARPRRRRCRRPASAASGGSSSGCCPARAPRRRSAPPAAAAATADPSGRSGTRRSRRRCAGSPCRRSPAPCGCPTSSASAQTPWRAGLAAAGLRRTDRTWRAARRRRRGSGKRGDRRL